MTVAVIPERRRLALSAVEEARNRVLRMLEDQRARKRRQFGSTDTSRYRASTRQ
jgi:hypothetical protein